MGEEGEEERAGGDGGTTKEEEQLETPAGQEEQAGQAAEKLEARGHKQEVGRETLYLC